MSEGRTQRGPFEQVTFYLNIHLITAFPGSCKQREQQWTEFSRQKHAWCSREMKPRQSGWSGVRAGNQRVREGPDRRNWDLSGCDEVFRLQSWSFFQPNRPSDFKKNPLYLKLSCSCSHSYPCMDTLCLISSSPTLNPISENEAQINTIYEAFLDRSDGMCFFLFSMHQSIHSLKLNYSLGTHYVLGTLPGTRNTKINKTLSLPLRSPLEGEEGSHMGR